MLKLLSALKAIGSIFSFFNAILKYFERRSVKKSGKVEAQLEYQNEQVATLNKGLAAEQDFNDSLVRNPGSLRDDDQFRIPDEVSVVQPSTPAVVEGELGRPSDPASQKI